jgi:hypothetical protein
MYLAVTFGRSLLISARYVLNLSAAAKREARAPIHFSSRSTHFLSRLAKQPIGGA